MYKLKIEDKFNYNNPIVIESLGDRYSIIQNKDSEYYKELSRIYFDEEDGDYVFIGEYTPKGKFKMKNIIPIDRDLNVASILLETNKLFNKL